VVGDTVTTKLHRWSRAGTGCIYGAVLVVEPHWFSQNIYPVKPPQCISLLLYTMEVARPAFLGV